MNERIEQTKDAKFHVKRNYGYGSYIFDIDEVFLF